MAHHIDHNDYGGHPATPRMLRNASGSSRNSTTNFQGEATGNTEREIQSINQLKTYNSGQQQPEVSHHQRATSGHRVSSIPPPSNTHQKMAELLPPAAISSPASSNNDHQQELYSPSKVPPNTPSQQRKHSPQFAPQPGSKATSNQGVTPANSTSKSHTSGNAQQFHRKSIGDWNFIKTIGAGSMGRVKLAQHNASGEVCAVKIVPRAAKLFQRAHANDPPVTNAQMAEKRQKEYEKEVARDRRTIREAALGRLLFHPYICRLYEMVTMSNHYYMLFEYVEGGQMLDYIVSHGSLKEQNARKFVRGIASALDYCHKNSVVHRDLKIENIMINQKGDIKIIDFGLSNLFSPKNLLKTYCGSLYFAAPELLSAKPYTGPEVDIWSFGVVLYVLVCGKVPFDDKSVSVLHEKIKRGSVEYPEFLSPECVNLLQRMLVVDPTKRATLYEIIHHPWMNKGYDSPPQSYVPKRVPLKLPLDPAIIKTIASFDLGSDHAVSTELTSILSSVEYQMSVENWYKLAKQGRDYNSASIANILPDPTAGYHPLISIYYLVDEMRKRKMAKQQEIMDRNQEKVQSAPQRSDKRSSQQSTEASQNAQSQSLQSVQQPIPNSVANSNIQTPKSGTISNSRFTSPKPDANHSTTPSIQLEIPSEDHTSQARTEAIPISLAPPEPAHTSYGAGSEGHSNEPAVNQLPEQQPSSPIPESLDPNANKTGFNSLFRKLSGKYKAPSSPKKDSQGSPEFQFPPERENNYVHDPMVRRGVSMKITAKEKLSNSRVNLNTPDKPGYTGNPTKSHARSSSGKFQGFTPVEYMPPLPNINPQSYANTNSLAPSSKNLHPTARAKSLGGGHIAKETFNSRSRVDTTTRPPLPNHLASQNSEEIIDAYFDDVTLDDNEDNNKIPQLTEEQIIEQFNHARPNSMPSIEFPKTLFLKGFFSVQTTSTKPLPVIRYNIISVLSRLGVKFQEVKGGFICSFNGDHTIARESNEEKELYGDAFKSTSSSIEKATNTTSSSEKEQQLQRTPSRTLTPDSQEKGLQRQPSVSFNAQAIASPDYKTHRTSNSIGGHRRKFSIGQSILTSYRKKNGSQVIMPPNTPATTKVVRLDDDDIDTSNADGDSVDSINGMNLGGGSDMLDQSKLEQRARQNHQRSNSVQHKIRSPLKFEILVVKVPLVGLYGVQFKKIFGNTWNYKTLASEILNDLNL